MLEILPYHLSCSIYIRLIVTQASGKTWESHEVSPEHQRKLLLQALKLIRSTQLTWVQFKQEIQRVMNAELMSTFLKEMNDLQDIDSLCDTVKSLENLFEADSLMKCSILGLFLRKNILALKKMSFQKIGLFFKSVKNYLLENNTQNFRPESSPLDTTHFMHLNSKIQDIEGTIYEREKENLIELSNTDYPKSNQFALEDSILFSRNKVERFISQQTKFLVSNEMKALPPEKLRSNCVKIQKMYPDISDIHYLNFLNYLRLSETERATTFLQLYFDFKVFQDEKKEENSEIEKHQVKFKRFRFCALNLGIMHCCYENYKESLISLKEAVRMAQETNDDKCLQHALFWLKIVEGENNKGKSKFTEFNENIVCSIENKDDTLEGETSQLKLINKLGMLRVFKDKVSGGKILPSILISKVCQILCTMPSLMDAAGLALSAFICFYGFNCVSSSLCQFPLLTTINENICSLSDENFVLSLCQLAHHHFVQGYFSEAKSIIGFASTQISLYNRNQKMIEFCSLQIDFHQNIYERNMGSIAEIVKKISFIDSLEGQYMTVVVDILNGSFGKAFKDINLLLSKFSSQKCLPVLEGKVHLLLVDLLMTSSSAIAITKLCELLTFADKYYLSGLKIDAQISLAHVYITMKMYKKAQLSLEKVSLQVLSNGTCFQKGTLIYLQAQCKLLQFANTIVQDKCELLIVASMLDQSLTYFARGNILAKKRDVLHKLSIVYHHLGYIQERNKAATLYRILNEKVKGFTDMVCF